MRKLITILGILLLALTACAPSNGGIPQATGMKESVPSSVTGTSADEEDKLIEQVKADTESKNVKSQVFFLPINNKKGKPGDSVVFGSIFNLVNTQPGTYFAKIQFIEGRDKSSNKIEVDKDTVNAWLKYSKTPSFAIEEKGSEFVPIIVRVKDEVAPGIETTPGTYEFEVAFFRVVDNEFDDDVENAVKSVYVKVE